MKPSVAAGSQIDFRVQFLRFLIHFWSVFSTMALDSHLLPLYYSLSSSNRNAEYMNTQTFHWKKCTHLVQNFDLNTYTNLLGNVTRSLQFGFGLQINVTIWTTALLLPLPPPQHEHFLAFIATVKIIANTLSVILM